MKNIICLIFGHKWRTQVIKNVKYNQSTVGCKRCKQPKYK